MAANSLGIGMDAVTAESVLEIASLPGLTSDLLTSFENTLLAAHEQEGATSMHSMGLLMRNRLTQGRVESLFFALAQAGALRCLERNRRGHLFDSYRVDPDRLRQIIYDAGIARHTIEQLQKSDSQVDLVATLPDSLPLSPQTRQAILPLVAALHRLITDAEQEILILNPFFEHEGFDRLASALLAAAARGATITIVTRRLSDTTSINHQVLKELLLQACAQGLGKRFAFWEYQQVEGARMVLTSHAKVLVADGEKAYIGSANLTEYGMSRFLEIGVILEGVQVEHLKRILKAVLESEQARQVIFSTAEAD